MPDKIKAHTVARPRPLRSRFTKRLCQRIAAKFTALLERLLQSRHRYQQIRPRSLILTANVPVRKSKGLPFARTQVAESTRPKKQRSVNIV